MLPMRSVVSAPVSPLRLFLLILTVVFLAEAGVMLLLAHLLPGI